MDAHTIVFDWDGNARQPGAVPDGGDATDPREGFAGRGRVGTREVGCLSPERLLLHRTGYPPQDKDRHNVGLRCTRFGSKRPHGY